MKSAYFPNCPTRRKTEGSSASVPLRKTQIPPSIYHIVVYRNLYNIYIVSVREYCCIFVFVSPLHAASKNSPSRGRNSTKFSDFEKQ